MSRNIMLNLFSSLWHVNDSDSAHNYTCLVIFRLWTVSIEINVLQSIKYFIILCRVYFDALTVYPAEGKKSLKSPLVSVAFLLNISCHF